MAHEVTVHFPVGKRWVVAPSIIDGKQYDEEEVRKMYMEGKAKAFGIFDNEEDALEYAIERSESFDKHDEENMNNKDITNAQTEANIKQSIGDYDFKSLANQYASTPMTRDIRKDVPSTPPTERQTLMGVRDKTPENHMMAYITPEEGELLRRAGGSGNMTPEGIPMYANDLTADEMEDELKESETNYKSIMDKVYKEAEERLSPETRDRLLQEAMEQNRKLEASDDFGGSMSNEAASNRVNLMYDALLEDELSKYGPPDWLVEMREKVQKIPAKLKSLMGRFAD